MCTYENKERAGMQAGSGEEEVEDNELNEQRAAAVAEEKDSVREITGRRVSERARCMLDEREE